MLLRDWCERYIGARLGLRESSAVQLRVAVRRLDAWAGHPVDLAELSAILLVSYLRAQLSAGQSAATLRSKRSAIVSLWRAAAREAGAPPVEDVPPIPVPQRLPEAWTAAEIGRLLRACREVRGRIGPCRASDWFCGLVLTAYDTGERVGALRAIARHDWVNGSVIVRAEAQKTRRDRVLPISQQTADALARLHRHDCKCSLLFPWCFSREHLWRRFRVIVMNAGLSAPKGRMSLFHKLRRTSGSLIEAAGGDGSRHLGNTRGVFIASYLDPRILGRGQLDLLPRPF